MKQQRAPSSGLSTNDKSSPGFVEINARCMRLRQRFQTGQRAGKGLSLCKRRCGCHALSSMIGHHCFDNRLRPTRRWIGLSSGGASRRLLASRSTLRWARIQFREHVSVVRAAEHAIDSTSFSAVRSHHIPRRMLAHRTSSARTRSARRQMTSLAPASLRLTRAAYCSVRKQGIRQWPGKDYACPNTAVVLVGER